MRIAFYGSSLTSSYWNGAATYYRGIIRALAQLGYDVTFYEPDAYDRQKNRDIDPPPWCRVVVYPATIEGVQQATACACHADIVVKASGIGVFDDELLAASIAPIVLTVVRGVLVSLPGLAGSRTTCHSGRSACNSAGSATALSSSSLPLNGSKVPRTIGLAVPGMSVSAPVTWC